MPHLNPVVSVSEPTAYNSELNTVQYNAPVDVVHVYNAQFDGLSSVMTHGAEGSPMIP